MRKNRKAPRDSSSPARPAEGEAVAKSTVSGPRKGLANNRADPAMRKAQGTQALAAAFPYNRLKPGEIGKAARVPKPGATAQPSDPAVTGSTLSEANTTPKTGAPARAA